MILIAHHRSDALASRHLAALRKKYFRADLLSRRNATGAYSERGRTFVYEVQEKPPTKRIEVVVHFDYESSKSNDLLRFQVHVFGPGDATDDEIISAIRQRNQGEPWPKGYRQKAIYWGHPPAALERDPAWYAKRPLRRGLRQRAIAAGSASIVARKSTVRPNRSARRKAKK